MGAYDCDCINNLEYEWRERKAQLSKKDTTKDTTSDLISRKATIDAVNNAFDRETLLTGFVRSIALRVIRDMPSVQPEVLACGNEELVAQPEPTDIDAKEAVYNLAEKIGIHQLFALTVELRGEPIQPEPHEGRWINGKCDLCGEHAPFWCMASTYHESNFCPNCGAKMKGERQK